MLYQFLLNFVDTFSFLNVFKYLTFRTGLSFFTSLVIVLIVGGPFIKFFSKQKILNPRIPVKISANQKLKKKIKIFKFLECFLLIFIYIGRFGGSLSLYFY